MNLREIFIALGLDWDSSGFAQAIAAEKLLEKGAKLLVDAIKAIPGALIDATVATTEYGSKVNDAHLATGIAVDTLQSFGFAAKQTGSDSETMWAVLTKLQNTMGEAADGSKEAKKGFADLGVAVTDSHGKLKPVDLVFRQITARLGEIPNATDRAHKAFGVFSRQAAGLLPLFAEGEKGLEGYVDLFNDLGAGMDAGAVAAADRFGDSIDTVKVVLAAFQHDVGGVLIAELQPLVDLFIEWVRVNRALIRTRLQQFAEGVADALKALVRTFALLVQLGMWLANNWKLLAILLGSTLLALMVVFNGLLIEQLVYWALNTAAALAYGAVLVVTGLKAAAAWLAAAAPIILLAALFALLALAAEDLYVFLKGGDSVIGDFGRKWTKFLDEWMADDMDDGWLMTALKAVLWMLTDIGVRFPAAIGEWKDMIVKFFTVDIPQAVRDFVAKFPGLMDPLSLGGRTFGQAMSSKFPGAAGLFGGGAAGPEAAAAASSAANSVGVLAPTFNAGGFTVVAQPGQDTEQVAGAVVSTMDSWWNDKLSGAAGATGGGG